MGDVEKMVAEMKRLAGYASDYPRHFAKVAAPASEVIALIAEYERLKGIVDALPKMADGAIIQLGKPAWVQAVSGPLPLLVETMQWEGGSVWVNDYEPGDLYSTKDAATKGDPNG